MSRNRTLMILFVVMLVISVASAVLWLRSSAVRRNTEISSVINSSSVLQENVYKTNLPPISVENNGAQKIIVVTGRIQAARLDGSNAYFDIEINPHDDQKVLLQVDLGSLNSDVADYDQSYDTKALTVTGTFTNRPVSEVFEKYKSRIGDTLSVALLASVDPKDFGNECREICLERKTVFETYSSSNLLLESPKAIRGSTLKVGSVMRIGK